MSDRTLTLTHVFVYAKDLRLGDYVMDAADNAVHGSLEAVAIATFNGRAVRVLTLDNGAEAAMTLVQDVDLPVMVRVTRDKEGTIFPWSPVDSWTPEG